MIPPEKPGRRARGFAPNIGVARTAFRGRGIVGAPEGLDPIRRLIRLVVHPSECYYPGDGVQEDSIVLWFRR